MKKVFTFIFFITLLMFLLPGCGEKKTPAGISREDSLRTVITKLTDTLIVHYSKRPPAYILAKGKKYYRFRSKSGSFGTELILALNRVDMKNLNRHFPLVIPDTLVKDMLYYAPFPLKINGAAYIPKMLIISQQLQVFAAYEFGCLVKWGPTSTGKQETPTPNGLFHTNWKAKETTSTFNDEWDLKWCFNLDNFVGVSIHQFELPGYPASHSCTRIKAEDAEWFYYWAEQWVVTSDEENIRAYGTPVIIFGEYEYDAPEIWKLIASEPDKAVYNKEKIESLVSQYSGTILSRKVVRDSVIASDKRAKDLKVAKK